MAAIDEVVTTKTATTMTVKKTSEKMSMTMMTLPDILEAFQEELPDEIDGSNEYFDMAQSAMDMHHYELAKYLYAMGKDEYTHASFIHDTLVKYDIPVPEEQRASFEELKTRIHKIFR
jgi:ferritin